MRALRTPSRAHHILTQEKPGSGELPRPLSGWVLQPPVEMHPPSAWALADQPRGLQREGAADRSAHAGALSDVKRTEKMVNTARTA